MPVASLITLLLLKSPQASFPIDGAKGIVENFESGTFSNWKITGSFGRANMPTNAAEFNIRYKSTPIANFEGRYFALSLDRSNSEVGKAVSPSFEIPNDWSQITFEILGGIDPSKTAFRLIRDDNGSPVRTASGDGTLAFVHKYWHVSDLRGKMVHFEIEDSATNTYGFIGLDNIRGVTEATLLKANELKVDFSNLTHQSQVLGAAQAWRAKYHLPGVWCAAVKNGRVVACVTTGVNNPDLGDGPSLDHHLNIGSVSKVVTAMMISTFVARGVITYNTTIGEVFPGLVAKYPSSPFRSVTLRQLIAHTSGLTKGVRFSTSDLPTGIAWRLKHVEAALASDQTVPPGTAYEYNNAGPVIATAMTEQRLAESPLAKDFGNSYEDWLTGPVGKAIGLTNPRMLNYALPPDRDSVQPNYVSESGFKPNHRLGKDSFKFAPQGSCSITLTDLCRFSIAMMENSMQLPSTQYRSVFSELVPPSNHTVGGWGLGVTSKFVDHNGDTGRGEYAYLRVHPTRKLAIIFYSNGNIEDRDKSRVFRGEITSEIAKLLDQL